MQAYGIQAPVSAGITENTKGVPVSILKNAGQDGKEAEYQPVVANLSGYLDTLWTEAKQAKDPITERLLKCSRQRNGEYDPDKLAEIQQTGGSEIYMMLTSVKCRAASAWIREIMQPANDRAWSIKPTPIPDLSDEVKEQIVMIVRAQAAEAEQKIGPVSGEQFRKRFEDVQEEVKAAMMKAATRASELMAAKIDDQMTDGKWRQSLRDFIDDLVTYPTAFFEGPVLRRRNKLSWAVSRAVAEKSKFIPVVDEEVVMEFDRISPYDVYPGPDAGDNLQETHLFVRRKIKPSTLESYRGVEGFDPVAINEVLEQYGDQGFREWLSHDQERSRVEARPYEFLYRTGKIDMLRFFGEVSGKLLLEWGMDEEQIPDRHRFYAVECWKIGKYVVKATINSHPLGSHNIHATCFERIPGALWGNALPEMMRDDQAMCNGAARSLSNNMGLASGPMVSYNDTSRLPIGEDPTQIYPWKVFQFGPDNTATTHRPPIEFYQPSMHADALLKIFEHFSRKAGEHTNIPDYAYGEVGGARGALATASGMSMAIGNASKTIKQTIANIDLDIIEPVVRGVYIHNMRYDPDDSIKGDVTIKARGAASLLVKEQAQIRRNEFLERTNNPIDLEITGKKGRKAVLKEAAKALDIPVEEVIPDDDEEGQMDPQQAAQMIEQLQKELELAKDPQEIARIQAETAIAEAELEAETADKDRKLKRDIEASRSLHNHRKMTTAGVRQPIHSESQMVA